MTDREVTPVDRKSLLLRRIFGLQYRGCCYSSTCTSAVIINVGFGTHCLVEEHNIVRGELELHARSSHNHCRCHVVPFSAHSHPTNTAPRLVEQDRICKSQLGPQYTRCAVLAAAWFFFSVSLSAQPSSVLPPPIYLARSGRCSSIAFVRALPASPWLLSWDMTAQREGAWRSS